MQNSTGSGSEQGFPPSFVEMLRKGQGCLSGIWKGGSLLDVGLKLGLLDRQGSVQGGALWLWAQGGGLTALTALWSPSLYVGRPCVLLLQGAPEGE